MDLGKMGRRNKGREKETEESDRLGETRHREGKLGLEIEQQLSKAESQNRTQGRFWCRLRHPGMSQRPLQSTLSLPQGLNKFLDSLFCPHGAPHEMPPSL